MPNTTVRYPDNLYVSYNVNGISRQLIKESYYWDFDASVQPSTKTILDISNSNFDNAKDLSGSIFGNSLNPLVDLSGYSFNDLSGNIYDFSGHIVDGSGHIIDPNNGVIDLSGSVIFDISGNLIKTITNFALSNNSYKRMLDYKLSQYPLFNAIAFLTHSTNAGLFELGINTCNLAIQYYILYDNKTNVYSNVTVGGNVIRALPTDAELMQFFLLNIADFTDPQNRLYALQTANGKTVISKTTLAYRYVTEPAKTSRYINFADVSSKITVSAANDPSKKTIDTTFYLFSYPDVNNFAQSLLEYGTYSDDHLTFSSNSLNTICKSHYINSKHVRIGDNGVDENRYANKDDFLNSTGGTKEELILRAKYKEFNTFKGDFDNKHYLSIYCSEMSGKVDPELHYVKYVYKLLNNTTGYPDKDVLPTEATRFHNLTEAFSKKGNVWTDYNNFPKRFYYALNKDVRDVRINELVSNNNGIITDSDADVLDVIIPGHYVINNANETSKSYRNAVNILKNYESEKNIFAKYATGTDYNLTEKFSSSAYFFMNPDLYPWADDTLIDEIMTVYNYVGSINKNIIVDSKGASMENRPTYNDSQSQFITAMGKTDLKSAVTSRLASRPDLLIKDPTNNKQITLNNYVITQDPWNAGTIPTNNINNTALQRVILQHWNSEN
jgi:hypothetical protein